jgi:aminoglycoside 2'-N-acetyltransferase I
VVAVRRSSSADLTDRERVSLRSLCDEAFVHDGGFSDDDFDHAFGGAHFMVVEAGEIVSHASVVPRQMKSNRRALATGYVEAVATLPARQGTGLGTAVMREASAFIQDTYELGVLGTGVQAFYARLGWVVWRGPTSAVTPVGGLTPTPEDDGYVMALLTPETSGIDLAAPISCDWRPGDAW